MQERLERIRNRIDKKKGGSRDPHEWYPTRLKPDDQSIKYKFVVLPPLEEGDKCHGGKASRSMDGIFYVQIGQHWNRKPPLTCPRLTEGEECPMCEFGFELMNDTNDKKQRSFIAKNYLASPRYLANLFFIDDPVNPDELRGEVRWCALPKSVAQKMEEALYRDDDGGDSDEPLAYGFFYLTGIEDFGDEKNPGGYTFMMKVSHKSGYNNYDESHFLARTRGPLITDEDGEPDVAAIQEVLDKRFDLFTKFETPDPKVLKEIVSDILDDSGPQSSGFDADEEQEEAPRPKATKKVTTKEEVKVVNDEEDDEDDVVEGMEADAELDALLQDIKGD